MKEPRLLVNIIMTPDGTILHSKHLHDFQVHVDKNGETYKLDGGIICKRVSINKEPYKDISIYDTDKIQVIRKYLTRGTTGKNNEHKLKFIKLKNMTIEHINNTIEYIQNDKFSSDDFKDLMISTYKRELEYREQLEMKRNIKIWRDGNLAGCLGESSKLQIFNLGYKIASKVLNSSDLKRLKDI